MLPNTITLGARVYEANSIRPTSTERSIAGLEKTDKQSLFVGHEATAAGKVSSAMIFTSSTVNTVEGVSVPETVKAHIKLQYMEGALASANTDSAISEVRADLIALVSDDILWAKFINHEH